MRAHGRPCCQHEGTGAEHLLRSSPAVISLPEMCSASTHSSVAIHGSGRVDFNSLAGARG
ncbi:hypothetical protein BDV06DRAFT_189429 [Aspergillus oleicola]